MNEQARHVLQLGMFFAAAVIILDILLIQIPILDWFALGVAFMLVAVLILNSVVRLVPREVRKHRQNQQVEDEFHYLTHVVDRTIRDHDEMSARILSEELRSLVLGTIAVRMRLSKKQILERVENDRDSVQAIVKDEQIMKLLTGNVPMSDVADEKQFEKLLAKIEGWSH